MKPKLVGLFAMCLMIVVSGVATAQERAAIDVWRSVEQTEEIVGFFHNLFESIGIVITDTGEELTCRHLGDSIAFEDGIDLETVDYIVEVERFQIERLASYANQGDIAPEEQYRVMAEVFTPATRALLSHPAINTPMLRLLSGAERTIHVLLESPVPGEPDVMHTLLYDQGWVVEEGLVGTPDRLYHLDMEKAITFQKVAYAIGTKRNPIARIRFSMWYRRWRRDVSERL